MTRQAASSTAILRRPARRPGPRPTAWLAVIADAVLEIRPLEPGGDNHGDYSDDEGTGTDQEDTSYPAEAGVTARGRPVRRDRQDERSQQAQPARQRQDPLGDQVPHAAQQGPPEE